MQAKVTLKEKEEYPNKAENSSEIETAISDDKNVAATYNFIVNIVASLNILLKDSFQVVIRNGIDLIINYINKFKNLLSIKISKNFSSTDVFFLTLKQRGFIAVIFMLYLNSICCFWIKRAAVLFF